MHGRDRKVGQPEPGVLRDQPPVVPARDFAEEEVGQQFTVQAQLVRPDTGQFANGTTAPSTEGSWIRCCSRSSPARFGLSVPPKSTCRAATWSPPALEPVGW